MHVLAALALAALPVHPAPAHFVRHVDNPWFPLRPGTTYIYRGTQESEPVRDTVRGPAQHAADPGRPLHRGARPGVRARPARGADDRLLRAGSTAATSGTSASRRPSSTPNGHVTSTRGLVAARRPRRAGRHLHAGASARRADASSRSSCAGTPRTVSRSPSRPRARVTPYVHVGHAVRTKEFDAARAGHLRRQALRLRDRQRRGAVADRAARGAAPAVSTTVPAPGAADERTRDRRDRRCAS